MSVGVSGRLNQAPDRLAHEAGRENEHRREREQLQRLAERGKAVEARQHDEVERERRQIDGQMRDAAAEHARERAAGAPAPAATPVSIAAPISSVCCRISTKAAGTM